MGSTAGDEHPSARSWRWWVFDVLVAAGVAGFTLISLLQVGLGVQGSAFVLVGLTLPVFFRRVQPVPVLLVVTAVTVGVSLAEPQLAASMAVLVALYTVAAQRPRREALAAAAVVEVALLLVGSRVPDVDRWYAGVFLTGLVVAALGLGLYTAVRRAYLAELQDRAARLEHERDQQGALAAAAERARIAREMHDIVAHHLTVIVSLSQGAVAMSPPEQDVAVLQAITTTGRQALADTRRLLGVLRDDMPGDDVPGEDVPGEDASGGSSRTPAPGLSEVDALVEQVRAAGLPVSFEVQGATPAMSAGGQLTVYRIIQEALTNTLKHAGPGAATVVRLHYLSDEVQIEVLDDGAGTGGVAPAGPNGGPGRGLVGLHERAQAFGGSVQTGAVTPTGWRLTARIRLDAVASR